MATLDATRGGDVNDYSAGNRPLPGLYHAVVKTAEETVSSQKGTPGYIVTFEILAGTIPGMEGREVEEKFWVSDKTVDRLVRFALSAGVLKAGDKADDTILLQTPGHQLIVEVEEEEYENKDGRKGKKSLISFGGLWPVGHEDVKHVPLNAEALKLAGITVPAGGGNAAGEKQEAKPAGKRKAKVADAEKPAEKEQAPAEKTAAAADDWSDVLN